MANTANGTRPNLGADEITAVQISTLTRPEEVIRSADYKRSCFLSRRRRVVLFDLGVDRVVPAGWITPTESGLSFRQIASLEADQLMCRLEDIAAGRPQ